MVGDDAHLGRAGDDRDAALAVGQRPGVGQSRRVGRVGRGNQADPVVREPNLARALLDGDTHAVGGDDVGLRRADADARRAGTEEDAHIVGGGRAGGADADAVAVDRRGRAGLAVLDPGHGAGADYVADDVGLRGVDDQHAVVIGQRLVVGVEADRVAEHARARHAAAADHHAVPAALGHAVAGDAVAAAGTVAADAGVGRAAQHRDAAQPIGRGGAPVGRHAEPVGFDHGAARGRADNADSVALEAADRDAAHDDARAVDQQPRGVAGLAAVEVDGRRPVGAPAGLGRRVERGVRAAQRRQLRAGRDHGRAAQREADAVCAVGLVGGVNRGAQAADGGAAVGAGIVGGVDRPDARLGGVLRARAAGERQRGEQDGSEQRGGGGPFQRVAPGRRAAESSRICRRSPGVSSNGSERGAARCVV